MWPVMGLEYHICLITIESQRFHDVLCPCVSVMKQGGIDAGMQRQETDDALILTINIPKARRRAPDAQRGEPVPVG